MHVACWVYIFKKASNLKGTGYSTGDLLTESTVVIRLAAENLTTGQTTCQSMISCVYFLNR